MLPFGISVDTMPAFDADAIAASQFAAGPASGASLAAADADYATAHAAGVASVMPPASTGQILANAGSTVLTVDIANAVSYPTTPAEPAGITRREMFIGLDSTEACFQDACRECFGVAKGVTHEIQQSKLLMAWCAARV